MSRSRTLLTRVGKLLQVARTMTEEELANWPKDIAREYGSGDELQLVLGVVKAVRQERCDKEEPPRGL